MMTPDVGSGGLGRFDQFRDSHAIRKAYISRSNISRCPMDHPANRMAPTAASAGASGSQHDAVAVAKYNKGVATFTVVKGGLMSAATIGGETFSYKPR
jgi:hypothetical protein